MYIKNKLFSFVKVIGREQREQNQRKQEETEREIQTRERKAFIHKLRYRGGDREGDIDQREEGIHPQAQV